MPISLVRGLGVCITSVGLNFLLFVFVFVFVFVFFFALLCERKVSASFAHPQPCSATPPPNSESVCGSVNASNHYKKEVRERQITLFLKKNQLFIFMSRKTPIIVIF